MTAEIRRRILQATKVTPGDVLLVPPRILPKTPSGKLRRSETRDRYLADTLTRRRSPAWLQITRLTLGAGWLALMALLWRRFRRDR